MTSFLLLSDFATHRAGAILDPAVGDNVAGLMADGASFAPSTPALEGAVQRIRDSNRGHLAEDLGALFAAAVGPAALPVDSDGVARLYVNPGGDDGNHGLIAAEPFATIAAALARVDRASRALQDDAIEVMLSAGTHALTEPLRLRVAPLTSLTLKGPSSDLDLAADGTVTGATAWDITDAGAALVANAHDSATLLAWDPADAPGTLQVRTIRANGATAIGVVRLFDPAPSPGWEYSILVPTATITLAGNELTDLFADVGGYRHKLDTAFVRVVIS